MGRPISLVAGLCVLVALLACARPSWAIPAFARRYETSCSTCHTQFPNLNAFGEAFRRNGYQFPAGADAEAIKQKPMTLVSEARRDLFPRSDWPTDLARYPPLALVLDGSVPIFPDASTRPSGEQAVSFDRMFGQATLFLGARAGDHVAVFASVAFLTSAPPVELQRGFIVFSNLVGEGLLHVRVGQFEPQVFSFSSYRRIGGPEYLIVNDALTPSYFSLEPFVRGVNLSGTVGGRFGWDAAWVQGVEATNYGAESVRQLPRDGYGHIYTRIGGMRLDGVEPSGPDTWNASRSDASLDLGAFVYGGEHSVDADENPATPPENDVMTKVGGDALARLGDVSMLVAGAYERHSFETVPVQSRVQGLGELTWRLFPWMAAVVRAEAQAGSAGTVRRLVPILTVHPRINLKLQTYAVIEDVRAALAGYRVMELDVAAKYAF
jgi:hypothetical protein